MLLKESFDAQVQFMSNGKERFVAGTVHYGMLFLSLYAAFVQLHMHDGFFSRIN